MRTAVSLAPVVVAALAVLAAACVVGTGATGHMPTARRPGVIQFCDDYSSSYNFSAAALSQWQQALPAVAEPGDLLYFRWINEASYAPSGAMKLADGSAATFDLPPVGAAPTPPDQFDPPAAKTAYAGKVQKVDAERRWFDGVVKSAADQLRGVRIPPPAQGTDVNGCVVKACELLHGPGDLLWIASDLEDNVGTPLNCNLHGAQVVVSFFQCDVPCPGKQWAWASTLGRHGAGGTTYLDPSLPLPAMIQQIKEVRRAH